MAHRLSTIGLLVPAATLALSCSGSRATGPSSTPPPAGPSVAAGTAFTVRSGETDEAVAGATITLAAVSPAGAFTTSYTTDGAGQFRLDRTVLLSTQPLLDITAPGFLARATLLRQEEPALTLWPSSSQTGLDEGFSSTIAYSSSSCPAVSTGQASLRKLPSSATRAQIVLSDALREATGVEAAQQLAITRLNLALGDGPQFELATTAAAGGLTFAAELDPTNSTCVDDGLLHAVTQLNLNGLNVVGGRIVYCSIGAARSATLSLHELGHATGLYHSASTSDVMYCSSGRPANFSSRERLVMRLARQRRSGNRWPDNDRLANPLLISAEGQVERIACSDMDRSR